MKKNKFKNVVPLGFFCGIAMEMKRIGLRTCSYPFDWVLSDFYYVLECIKQSFQDFLSEDLLIVNTEESGQKGYYVIRNTKYNIDFFHDFSKSRSINEQLDDVKIKYQRRINRFYRDIQEPTLFIRYVRNNEETEYINKNYMSILEYLKGFNIDNRIIYIINDDLKLDFKDNVYIVKKDKNDIVSRKCLKSNNKLKSYILNSVEWNILKRYKLILLYFYEKCKNKLRRKDNIK